MQVRIKSRKTQPTTPPPPRNHQGEGFSLGNLSSQNVSVLNSTRVLPLSVTCRTSTMWMWYSTFEPQAGSSRDPDLTNTCTVRRRYGNPSCDDVIEVPSAVRCGPGHARRVCVPRRRGGTGEAFVWSLGKTRLSSVRHTERSGLLGSRPQASVHAQFDNVGATATRALFTISYILN